MRDDTTGSVDRSQETDATHDENNDGGANSGMTIDGRTRSRNGGQAPTGGVDRTDTSNDDGGNGGGDLLPDNPQVVLVLVIVTALVLRYSLSGGGR